MQRSTGFPVTIDVDLQYARDTIAAGDFIMYRQKLHLVRDIQDVRWLQPHAIRVRVTLLPMPDDFTDLWIARQGARLLDVPGKWQEGEM